MQRKDMAKERKKEASNKFSLVSLYPNYNQDVFWFPVNVLVHPSLLYRKEKLIINGHYAN